MLILVSCIFLFCHCIPNISQLATPLHYATSLKISGWPSGVPFDPFYLHSSSVHFRWMGRSRVKILQTYWTPLTYHQLQWRFVLYHPLHPIFVWPAPALVKPRQKCYPLQLIGHVSGIDWNITDSFNTVLSVTVFSCCEMFAHCPRGSSGQKPRLSAPCLPVSLLLIALSAPELCTWPSLESYPKQPQVEAWMACFSWKMPFMLISALPGLYGTFPGVVSVC